MEDIVLVESTVSYTWPAVTDRSVDN